MAIIFKTGKPYAYEVKHRGLLPSFDRLPGKGVLLFSALDTYQELHIAKFLESWHIPTAIISMPLVHATVRLSIGSFTELKIYDTLVPIDRIGANWCINTLEQPLRSELEPSEHGFILSEWHSSLAIFRSQIHGIWVNSPDQGLLSRTAVIQLARELGFRTPHTLITNDNGAAVKFYQDLGGRCVAKRVGHDFPTNHDGTTVQIFTTRLKKKDIESQNLSGCPVLLQEEIQKTYEYRVYVIGDEVIPFRITAANFVDWREQEPGQCIIKPYQLDTQIIDRIRKMVGVLGLRYAAVDFIEDLNKDLYFLEVNPHGAFEFCDQLISPSIGERIAIYLRSLL
jgi:hypothetical protein